MKSNDQCGGNGNSFSDFALFKCKKHFFATTKTRFSFYTYLVLPEISGEEYIKRHNSTHDME